MLPFPLHLTRGVSDLGFTDASTDDVPIHTQGAIYLITTQTFTYYVH